MLVGRTLPASLACAYRTFCALDALRATDSAETDVELEAAEVDAGYCLDRPTTAPAGCTCGPAAPHGFGVEFSDI